MEEGAGDGGRRTRQRTPAGHAGLDAPWKYHSVLEGSDRLGGKNRALFVKVTLLPERAGEVEGRTMG